MRDPSTSLIPGREVLLTIEKPAAGGRMIARADGQIVLVSGAIPGEVVRARVDRVGKGVAYASAVGIDTSSPDRVNPSGDPLCGGCTYAHIAYARQLVLKGDVIRDALVRIGHIDWTPVISVAPSSPVGYRMRARLHVSGGRVGFFREGTHELCDARLTQQLLPATLDAAEALVQTLAHGGRTSGVMEIAENVDASERVVHLDLIPQVANDVFRDGQVPLGFTGVTTSSASSRRLRILAGREYVTDRLDIDGRSVELRRNVLAFFQGNRYLLERLVGHVLAAIPDRVRVVDLYAGTGLFAISAAVLRNAEVTAVEGDTLSAADLAENSRAAEGRVVPIRESVEDFTRARVRSSPVDLLIVDPPRTGMSRDALTGAIELAARAVVYVSCDVATFARDARRLLDAGYVLRQLDAFDLFPNTPHVETVAVFDRS
jgi:23S rRNA (uracil1939-C5)-methyltransferase